MVSDAPWTGPVPLGEGHYGDFFAACARGDLIVQRCSVCQRHQHAPRAVCRSCGGEPAWEVVGGTGTIHSFSVVRAHHQQPFRSETPYVIAVIELDDAEVRMLSRVTGTEPDDVRIGAAVEVYGVRFDLDRALPFWRPRR